MDVPAPQDEVAERAHRAPAAKQVGGPAGGEEGGREGAEEVEHGALPGGRLAVAGAGHSRRLHRGRLGGSQDVVRVLRERGGAAAPDASELERRGGGEGGPG